MSRISPAFHNLPLATRANGFAGLDAVLTFNNPLVVRHIAQLAEWQKTKVFDYRRPRAQSAEPRFQNGECGIFIGSSATRADIVANSKFEVGYGMLPYWPDVAGAPQNSIIGGATLWVLRDRPREEYKGVAKFFAFLSQPRGAGRLAPEHRLSADHPRRLRPDPRAGLLRAQSGRCDLDRADHAESADREFARAAARLVRADPRRRSRTSWSRRSPARNRPRPRSIPRSSAATGCCASSSGRARTGRVARRRKKWPDFCAFMCANLYLCMQFDRRPQVAGKGI